MNHSKRLLLWGHTFLMLVALALPVSLRAQDDFVYTDDDIRGANTVSAFSVSPSGALTLLPGSPFLTGGIGTANGYYASNRIAISAGDNFLFASNAGSNDVSVFRINRLTGALSLVEGSPFATGGSGELGGIALSPTPDGRFLMAGNSDSSNVTVFAISRGGALSPIEGSPFPAQSPPDGIKVSPNGKFLAVAEFNANQIEMFGISPNGSLASLGAYPGVAVAGGGIAGVDIDCYPRLLYDAEGSAGDTIVEGYSVSNKGALTPVPGSPFEPGVGQNSNVVLLGYSRGQKTLYVSNQSSETITAFGVSFNGSLSLLAPPFAMNRADQPSGMATSRDGRLLYAANRNSMISVFSVGEGGMLTEVAGSPFSTGQSGLLDSLTAFPPREIPLLEALIGG
jgi:6-phosphogluconolactonase (cycloisomerase 2 family)